MTFDFMFGRMRLNTRNMKIRLMRGTGEQHTRNPFPTVAGNLSLVTDKPELRLHDGVTPGGIPIPMEESTWKRLIELYTYKREL